MYSNSNEEFLELIQRSSSIKEVIKALGYNNTSGGANELFNQRCDELGIDWKKELRSKTYRRVRRTKENVFCVDSTASQDTVRSWFLKGEYVPYECEICGISEWNGQELTLRLDHINGNHNDNRLENLRWLCPNCDSQQSTYCGRNLRNQPYKNGNFCLDCGRPITKQKGVIRCSKCAHERTRKVIRPDKETLLAELKETNFVQVGKKYNVSDNAVRRWCKDYGLSTKSSDYKEPKEKKIFNPENNKACSAFTKDNKFIESFKNVRQAAQWVIEHSDATTLNGIDTHIKDVCNGKRKSAYGYVWQFDSICSVGREVYATPCKGV